MSLFTFAQPGLASGFKPDRHPPVGKAVNIEAGQQQVPNAIDLPVGLDSGSLDKEQWGGTGHNHNETVMESFPGPELGTQPFRPDVDTIIVAHHGVLDAMFTTEVVSEQWLPVAEQQLDECTSYAEEEDLPPPSEVALTKSRALLRRLSANIVSQPDIYPMDEASVAIDFRTSDGKSGVLFVVDRDGSGVMFHCMEGERGRTRVDDALQLMGEDAIAKLRHVGVQ